MPTLGLIACCKSKRLIGMRAGSIYQSALFKKSLAVAEKRCDTVAILSAKHGLLDLDKFIQPYDETLNEMRRNERAAWADRVMAQIKQEYPKHSLIYYAGEIYCEGLPVGYQPMKGLTIGRRLQWLDKQLEGKCLI